MSVSRGTSDSILAGINVPSLNGVSGGTLCGWVRLNSVPPVGPDPTDKYTCLSLAIGPPSAYPTTNSRLELEIENDPGPLPKINIVSRSLDTDAFAASNSSASGEIIAGTVYHLAVTVDYTNGVVSIYKNGVLLTTQIASITLGNTSATNSASSGLGNEDPGTPEQLDGYLEDWRVYSRPLSADEVQTIYACEGIDGIVNGLQQRYELQDNANGVGLIASAPADSAQRQISAFATAGTPSFAESIAPTYRRRLP